MSQALFESVEDLLAALDDDSRHYEESLHFANIAIVDVYEFLCGLRHYERTCGKIFHFFQLTEENSKNPVCCFTPAFCKLAALLGVREIIVHKPWPSHIHLAPPFKSDTACLLPLMGGSPETVFFQRSTTKLAGRDAPLSEAFGKICETILNQAEIVIVDNPDAYWFIPLMLFLANQERCLHEFRLTGTIQVGGIPLGKVATGLMIRMSHNVDKLTVSSYFSQVADLIVGATYKEVEILHCPSYERALNAILGADGSTLMVATIQMASKAVMPHPHPRPDPGRKIRVILHLVEDDDDFPDPPEEFVTVARKRVQRLGEEE